MKRRVLFLLLGCLLPCGGLVKAAEANDPNLLFRVDFDSYFVTADYAKGRKASTNFKSDLQLRMFPGVEGKGNALKLHDREFCVYSMPGNFQTRQGTVSLWISPQNWKFTEKLTHVFFEAKENNFRLILYKYKDLPYLCAFLQCGDRNNTVYAKVETADWENRQWHMLTAVWDKETLQLYVDGRIPKAYTPGNEHPAIPVRKMNRPLEIPPPAPDGIIGFGKLFGSFPFDSDSETGIDELKIYDRCLSAPEVAALYAEHVKPVSSDDKPMVVTIPKAASSITFDGKLDPDEWRDGVRLPLKKAFKIANHLVSSDTSVRLKNDGTNLCIGFVTDRKSTRHAQTKRDGEIFNDDCLEFYVKAPDGKDLWFAVNPNGALLDARDNQLGFDSGATAAARLGEDGAWSAELKIPLAALGNPADGAQINANFHALDFGSMPNGYLSWNSSPENVKAGPGSIRFGRPGEGLSIAEINHLYKGRGWLRADSAQPFTVTFVSNGVSPQTFNGSAKTSRFDFNLPPGTQMLQIDQSNDRGETVCRYGLDFTVSQPLTLEVSGLPSQHLLLLKADLNSAGPKVLRAVAEKTVTGRVALVKDGKSFADKEFTADTVSRVELPLPADLAAGVYQLEVAVSGRDFALKEAVPFRVPKRDPYLERVGVDHTVPTPWTPVTMAGANTFAVLDRQYGFGDGPFPIRMISRNQELIAAPFALNFNGKPVLWRNFRVAEQFDDYVVLTGDGVAGENYTVNWRGELWFDGLYKLDFELQTPAAGAKPIDSLNLTWSVPNRFTRYFLQRNKEYVVIPWNQNAIATPLDIVDASWLTGEECGMLWLPLSGANWNSAGKNAFFLKRGPADTAVTLDMIGKPSLPNGNVKYSLALMATPARRPPENFRTLNEGSYLDNAPYQNFQISSTAGDKRDPRADDVLGYAGHRMRDPAAFRREWVEPYAKRGVRLFPYHQPMALSQYDDEYDSALAEWRTLPGYIQANMKKGADVFDSIHCCGDGIADLHAWRLEQLFRDFPELGGIYYDIADVKSCNNILHGHGGTDAFGRKYMDSTAMSLRNYLMRIYKVAHRNGKQVFNHAHNYFNPVAHNFSDIWYPGENEVWLYGENPDYYYSEAPLAEYQSAWNPVIRGTAVVRCTQVTRVLSFMDKLKPRRKEMSTPEFSTRSFASAWLHDFNTDSDWINHSAVKRFWKIRSDLKLDQAKFSGYWTDQTVQSASPGVYASRYSWTGPSPCRELLAVGNLSRKNQKAALTVDWNALKLDPKNVEMTELWTGKPLTLNDLSEYVIPENHFILIGIKQK